MEAELILNAHAKLGEGAIWDTLTERLYWVDIEGCKFNIFDPVSLENIVYATNKRIGTVVPVDTHSVLVALQDGIAFIDLSNGTMRYHIATDVHKSHNKRFNDGKCDPKGRFWVGTLSMDGVPEVSSLYCIDHKLSIEEKIAGVTISNGIVWNFDSTAMYYIDTPTKKIVKYDFDLQSGQISNPEVVIQIENNMGFPDGMAIDSEGMLWIALWDGFCVARYNPQNGELMQKVNVPAPKVTSCAFGGENFDRLFITTASVEMTDDELTRYPASGGIFVANVNIKGAPTHRFKSV
jgi:sugar lactone lactonase YvrE